MSATNFAMICHLHFCRANMLKIWSASQDRLQVLNFETTKTFLKFTKHNILSRTSLDDETNICFRYRFYIDPEPLVWNISLFVSDLTDTRWMFWPNISDPNRKNKNTWSLLKLVSIMISFLFRVRLSCPLWWTKPKVLKDYVLIHVILVYRLVIRFLFWFDSEVDEDPSATQDNDVIECTKHPLRKLLPFCLLTLQTLLEDSLSFVIWRKSCRNSYSDSSINSLGYSFFICEAR